MNERLEAIVAGRVQMVMYRDFAARSARALGLTGEVRNMQEGSVKVIAEGPHDKLQQFVVFLKKGSIFSRIDNIELASKAASGEYQTFDITYD